ncbi:hypothetical protein HK101_004131 [Irineochytrium annulatum]|nr:hypothetical protein HK101_004131 [Irineochytrium annulatum]
MQRAGLRLLGLATPAATPRSCRYARTRAAGAISMPSRNASSVAPKKPAKLSSLPAPEDSSVPAASRPLSTMALPHLDRAAERDRALRADRAKVNAASSSTAFSTTSAASASAPPSPPRKPSKKSASTTTSGSSTPFPAKPADPLNSPEPAYGNVVSGYNTFDSGDVSLRLVHGGYLPRFQIAWESWGELNEAKDNVILLCTGLSGSSHARSHAGNTTPGWWEKFIGPGQPLDTDRFHVICTNVIGGCYGSTGPSSINANTGSRYATTFPVITLWDMVRAQFKFLDSIGVNKLHAVVGASMGGMQSLAAAALFPERVGRVVSISAAARSHPYSIALRFSQRQVLMSDPNWSRGFYYDGIVPHVGMKLARQIATITYRSGPEWERRFGRKKTDPHADPSMSADFLIESYLDHQGEKWCLQYDANSFIYISKAMDLFDMAIPPGPEPATAGPTPAERRNARAGGVAKQQQQQAEVQQGKVMEEEHRERRALVEGMRSISMPALILGVQSDILFPCWQQREVAECLREAGNKNVTFYELDSIYGHDTFLIDRTNVGGAVKGHLENAVVEN